MRNIVCDVPALRFPEFIKSWECSILEKLSKKIGDGIHSTPSYDDNGTFYFINGNNLNGGKIVITSSTKRVSEKEAYKNNAENLEANSILMSINGTIGNVALYHNEPIMLGKSACYINSKDNIDKNYLFYYLQYPKTQLYFEAELTGTTIKNLSLQSIRKTKIYIPTIEEQHKISRFLQKIDERISTQNKIIEDLKKLKSAISLKMLHSDSWEQFKIQDIASIGRGRVISSVEISQQENPLYPVYSSQTSNDGIMGYLDDFMFEGEYISWTTDGANAGTVFYRNGKFNCTNVCGLLKLKKGFDAHFVSLVLAEATRMYVSTNLANPKLMNNTMGNIQIRLPKLEEQKRISVVFRKLHGLLETHNSLIIKYSKQKQYLLSQMFI